MATVFISYRRADSEDVTGRIYDELVKSFDRSDVFMDVDSIPDGEDFVKIIRDQVRQCQVMVVIIGPNWAGRLANQKKRRLDDPNDFVRLEAEAALQRGMPIIPLLVSRADMPPATELPLSLRRLVQLNARPVRAKDFHRDMEKVVFAIEFQRTQWIALERERARQTEAALALTPSARETRSASERSDGGAPSLTLLMGTIGRHLWRAFARMLARVLIWAFISGIVAAGCAIGVAYWLTHHFPPDLPTYIAAGSLALSFAGFIGAVTALLEVIRAIRVAVELLVEESEKLAQAAVESAPPHAESHWAVAPRQTE